MSHSQRIMIGGDERGKKIRIEGDESYSQDGKIGKKMIFEGIKIIEGIRGSYSQDGEPVKMSFGKANSGMKIDVSKPTSTMGLSKSSRGSPYPQTPSSLPGPQDGAFTTSTSRLEPIPTPSTGGQPPPTKRQDEPDSDSESEAFVPELAVVALTTALSAALTSSRATAQSRAEPADHPTPAPVVAVTPPSTPPPSSSLSQSWPSSPSPAPPKPSAVVPTDVQHYESELYHRNELAEAAFFICWPTAQSTPPISTSLPTAPGSLDELYSIEKTRNTGCVFSVWDSGSAEAWLGENYDHEFMVRLCKSDIMGPLPSVLSIDSVALTIFAPLSASLIETAEELAKFSGFPVIVRPLEDYPSQLRSPNDESDAANTQNRSDGRAGQGSSSTQSSAPGPSAQVTGDSPRKAEKRREEPEKRREDPEKRQEGNGGGGEPQSPSEGATLDEVVHTTDVTLKASDNSKRFLRVITQVKLHPPNEIPNKSFGIKKATQCSIGGHVYLDVRSDYTINIDNALGSVGFIAESPSSLRTEYFDDLGHGTPRSKQTHVQTTGTTTTHSGQAGFIGFTPRLIYAPARGTATTDAIETADDEVAENWLVEPLRMDCIWGDEKFDYRGVNTNIYQRSQTIEGPGKKARDIQAKYGISVDVAQPVSEEIRNISFVYRHQIHCWVATKSKAGVRGLVVLAAHFIPDMRTKNPLYINDKPTLDVLNEVIVQGTSKDNRAGQTKSIRGQANDDAKDYFSLGTATVPEVEEPSRLGRLLLRKKSSQQETLLPISMVAHRGRKPLGWDHTNEEWYYPVWPKLDSKFRHSPNGSPVKWRLEWGGDGDISCTSSVAQNTPAVQQPESALRKEEGESNDT